MPGYCWEEVESGGCSAVAVEVPVIAVKRGIYFGKTIDYNV